MWISEWEWDDDNLKELARHSIDRQKVLEVAKQAPKFRRNKKRRAASHQMVGPDRGGQFWTICVLHLFDERWRAITGWCSEQSEIDWYNRT